MNTSRLRRVRAKRCRRRRALRRSCQVELLEKRELLAAGIWNNVVNPLNVDGDAGGFVSPVDVLVIVNELNGPKRSDPATGKLPRQVADGSNNPYLDVSCDSFVTPLDALIVVNYLNAGGPSQPTGQFHSGGGTYAAVACSPQLLEGAGFATELSRVLTLPDATSAVEVRFRAPQFDATSRKSIRDAFEIEVTDLDGNPVALPYASGRDAVYNWSEDLEPVFGMGTSTTTEPAETDSTATINLSGLAANSKVRVTARLVNNDADDLTSVILRGFNVVDAPQPVVGGLAGAAARGARTETLRLDALSDLSASIAANYGRTTLSGENSKLTTDLTITNVGNTPVMDGVLVAIGNISEPEAYALEPDGFLPDGRPFFDFTSQMMGMPLQPGASLHSREISFLNHSGKRFSYQLSTLGRINSAPAGFVSIPLTQIEAGRAYRYAARANDPDRDPLSYSIVTGPENLSIDASTGQVRWETTVVDVGAHSVQLRASDPYGLSVDQFFAIDVVESLQNRPPIFTSTPTTETTVAGSFDVITLSTGDSPAGLAVGTFGTSAYTSLVAINQGSQSLSFIEGLGRETYARPKELSVGQPPRSRQVLQSGYNVDLGLPAYEHRSWNQLEGVAQADFNGDGNLDVMSSVKFSYLDAQGNQVRERYVVATLGNDNGIFGTPTPFAVPGAVPDETETGLISLQAFDFDRDGFVDLLANDVKAQQLLFYRGRGNGGLAAAVATPLTTPLGSFLVADFNGDGNLDLLAQHSRPDTFGIMLGDGAGQFGSFQEFVNTPGIGYYDRAFSFGDVDADGDQDIVLGSWEGRRLSIFLNDGQAGFSAGLQLPTRPPFSNQGATHTSYVSVADYTGDGKADILYEAFESGLGLYRGDGSGTHFDYADAATGFPHRAGNAIGNNSTADIDGDGDLDVVLVLPGFNYNQYLGMLVAVNDGTGKFETQVVYDVSSATYATNGNNARALGVLTGDYNRDGMLDLLSTSTNRTYARDFSAVSVILADRPGSFAAPLDVRLTSQPNAGIAFVLSGDFNNDGFADLWGPRIQGSSVTRLGNGDGTFGPEITGTPAIGNEFLSQGFAADFDRDGNLDVIWQGNGGIQGGPRGRYLAALGNGDGSFRITFAQSVPDSFYGASQLTAGDFNQDGYPDFAAVAGDGVPFINVWINDPSQPGTFIEAPRNSLLRQAGASLAVADFTGDGIQDLAAMLRRPSNEAPADLLVFVGLGDGSFAEPSKAEVLRNSGVFAPQWLAAGDLNHDGHQDLVAKGAYGHAAVLLGDGNGTFGGHRDYLIDAYFDDIRSLRLFDLDADGNLDIVSTGDAYLGFDRGRVTLRRGLGDGTFSEREFYDVGGGNGTFALSDFDNDSRLDLAFHTTAGYGAATLLFGQRDGLTGIASADVNQDGWLDVVSVNNSNAHVTVLLGNHLGQWIRQSDILVDVGPVAVVAGDLDGDDRTDLITANRSGQSISVLMNSGGGFVRHDFDVGRAPSDLQLADVTGDDKSDALLIDAQLNSLFVLAGDGQGGFGQPGAFPLGERPSSLAIADSNADGHPDALIVLPGSQRVMILSGDGNGNFSLPQYIDVGVQPERIVAEDLNQDGHIDFAVTLPGEDALALFTSMGDGRFSRPQKIRVGKQPNSLAVRDANGDGRPDLLVTNVGDDTASVVLNRYDPSRVYRYGAVAVDPDSDTIEYSIVDGPGGMLLNSSSGEIRWSATADQVGLQPVTIRASDGRGGSATQSFTIAVEPPRANTAPVFTSLPESSLPADQPLRYQAQAADRESDALRYRLISAPAGAAIDPVTGQLEWDPRELGLSFNETPFEDRVVTIPHSDSLAVTSLTAEGWYKFDRNDIILNLFRKIVWQPYPFAQESYTLRLQWGALRGQIGTAFYGNDVEYAWSPTLHQWYHIAFTFDDASGTMKLFVDGREVASHVTTQRISTDGNPLQIGLNGEPFFGSISGFRLWDHARSAEQIQADMVSAVAPNALGLIADYRFREGDSQSVVDSSIHHNDGRLGGALSPERIPTLAANQQANFVISVEDGKGGYAEQSFSIDVVSVIPGSLAGTVFDDANRDGSRQVGEAALADWIVYLDANRNGHRDAAERFARTGANGGYELAGLPAGSYKLAVEPRAGFELPEVAQVEVQSGQTANTDWAAQSQVRGQVRGRVGLDIDRDGMPFGSQAVYDSDFDSPNPNLIGWSKRALATSPSGERFLGLFGKETVQLQVGSSESPLSPHDFLSVTFDLYVIQDWFGKSGFEPPHQWRFSIDGAQQLWTSFSNSSDAQAYPDQSPNGNHPARSGALANNSLGYTGFGDSIYRLTFTIPHSGPTAQLAFEGMITDRSNRRWGIDNVHIASREAAANRWQVFADLDRDGFLDPNEPSAATDAHGDYALSGLPAGAYVVRVAPPAGWAVIAPDAAAHDLVLATEEILDGFDFVVAARDSISGFRPLIVSKPGVEVKARESYRYAVAANDPSFRPLSYSLSAAPEGMVIDRRTGHIAWTPRVAQIGSQRVIVRAANDRGGFDLQDFSIHVERPNSNPIVTSVPPSRAVAGSAWTYELHAQDAEQAELHYTLVAAPAGASIEGNSGRIHWTPAATQPGDHSFAVVVSDGAGGIGQQTFTVVVQHDPVSTLPFSIRAPRSDASLLSLYLARTGGTDAAGQPLSGELVSGPSGLTLDPSGLIQWMPTSTQLGRHSLSIRFHSPGGSVEERAFALTVGQVIGNQPPQVASTPPAFATAGRLFSYDVLALDPDNDALAYELLSGPAGMSIDASRGTLRWVPGRDQTGPATVNLRVSDPQAGAATQSFVITTRLVGGPPAITSVPPTEATAGEAFLYSVVAQDSEHDPLTFTLLQAPVGMNIDARSGELSWTPSVEQIGTQPVIISVSDGVGGETSQGFSVRVAAGRNNRPPRISSRPFVYATVAQEYQYTLAASDPDGAAIRYSLRRAPPGMTIDPEAGIVRWTPTAAQAGRITVAIVAQDPDGGAAVQSFEIDILAENHSPQIVSTPPASLFAGAEFKYDAIGRDADLDPLKYELLANAPIGMSIDAFGRIRWSSSVADIGAHTFTVRASDPRGGTAIQSVSLDVVADTLAPRVSVLPTPGGWPWDGPIVVFVSAVDNVGVTDIQLKVNDRLVPLDARRMARLHAADWGFGTLTMVATARDGAGNIGTGTGHATYRNPDIDYETNPALPTALVTSPTVDASVVGRVEIIGTAAGPDFNDYRLSYARADQLVFTEFFHSTEEVSQGLLGTWDTSLLENDAYVIRLQVNDLVGSQAVVDVPVGLSGAWKLGNFRLSFEDLTIPVAGIPISIVRSYDTLRADRSGDFGFGWRMEYRNADLRTSLRKSGNESIGLYTPFKEGAKVYLTLPGGSRQGFTFTPDIRVLPGFGMNNNLTIAIPKFTPDRGVTSALSVRAGNTFVNEFGELFAAGGIPWNPASDDFGGGYTLTTREGIEYRIEGDTGLMTSATDRNGNTLTFSDAAITSSSGDVNVRFERDLQGRIVSVTDPAGHSVRYSYSAAGDLVRVTDREGNATQIQYRTDRPHFLDRVIDPMGREGVRSTYDTQGRLTSVIDANGAAVQLTIDADASLVKTADALGNQTTSAFDRLGNIVAMVAADGGVSTFAYDAEGRPSVTTDPLGRETHYTYDNRGNLAQILDPLGNTQSFVVDASERVTSTVDALGNESRFEYDSRGNTVAIVDPLGNRVEYEVDARGNVLATKSPQGSLSRAVYDARGNLSAILSPSGSQTQLTYDPNGRLQTQGVDGVTDWSLNYNREGLVTNYNFGEISRRIDYDASLRITGGTTASGRETRIQTDANGNFIGLSDTSSGFSLDSRLDILGNVVSQVDQRGNSVTHEYDAVGRPTAAVYADGTREAYRYDLAGQLVAMTNRAGFTTAYEYDAAGNLSVKTNPLGGKQLFRYDASGRLLAETDESGRTTSNQYDARGLLVASTLPGGIQIQNEYDAAGRLTATRSLGRQTTYVYDAVGQVASVIDGNGNRSDYGYVDGTQLLKEYRDANGRTTTYVYDDAGRLLQELGAAGVRKTIEYDPLGRTRSVTNPSGRTEFEYESDGRLTRLSTSDGETLAYSYGNGEFQRVTGRNGTMEIQYAPDSRLPLRVTEPDGRYVRYEYDGLGNQTLVAYAAAGGPEVAQQTEYDALNRPVRLTDGNGNATTLEYAGADLIRVNHANGIATHYAYNEAGLIASMRHVARSGDVVASFSYTWDEFGNRLSVTESDGSSTLYRYDLLGQLVHERQQDGFGNVRQSVDYVYDAVGNLLVRREASSETKFSYGPDNELLSDGTYSYAYDAAGNLISLTNSIGVVKSYAYDPRGRLIRITERTGSVTNYIYDFAGARVAIERDGVLTKLYVDRFNPSGLSQLLAESDATGNPVRFYSRFGGQLFTVREGAQTSVPLTDALGSVRLLADEQGNVTDRYGYGSFGDLRSHTGQSANPLLFTGEYREQSGEYFLRARYYDPQIGRFISRDPLVGRIDQPFSFAPYSYAENNPINKGDPSGKITLIELQQAIKNQVQLRGQDLERFRKGLERTGETAADASRYYGGLLAMAAALDSLEYLDAAFAFFGMKMFQGMWNTGRVGLDMLSDRNVKFHFYDNEWAKAYAQGKGWSNRPIALVSQAGRQAGGTVDLALLPGFFYVQDEAIGAETTPAYGFRPPLPLKTHGLKGTPSMAGIMVHEFSHIVLNTVDDEYQCENLVEKLINNTGFGLGPKNKTTKNGGAESPLRFDVNADNYRCYMRATVLGWHPLGELFGTLEDYFGGL